MRKTLEDLVALRQLLASATVNLEKARQHVTETLRRLDGKNGVAKLNAPAAFPGGPGDLPEANRGCERSIN